MFSEVPLVSAIMPTRGRPALAVRALECFMDQTWPNKELVIVDDADEPSFTDRLPATCCRFVNMGRLTVGAKRNMAIARSAADIIVHFDSDDWSAPGRMRSQVQRLLEGPQDITGYNCMLFTDGGEWWRYVGPPGYALGTSLMYRRSAWKARPFSIEQIGEDTSFIAGRNVSTADAGDLMLAWVHNDNTSEKRNSMRVGRKRWECLGVI